MAKRTDPTSEALSAWDKRYATMRSQGIDTKRFDPIMKQDISRVQQGHAAMTDLQARAVVEGTLSGQAPTAQHRPSGIMDVISNIVPDVANTITGLVTGIPRFVYHLPSEVTHTAQEVAHSSNDKWLRAHGFEPQNTGNLAHDVAAAFRNTAKTPILSLVPGIADIGALTTGAGRESLRQHPVQAALDIAPVGEAAASTLGHLGVLGDVGEAGSVAEAAAGGHPVSAALRAAREALPARLVEPAAERLMTIRRALHITPEDFANAPALATKTRQVTREYNIRTRAFSRAWDKLTPEQQVLATEVATMPAETLPADIPPEVATAVELGRDLSHWQGDMLSGAGEIVPVSHNGQTELYAKDSAVVSTLNRVKAGQDSLGALRERTATQIDRAIEQAQRGIDKRIASEEGKLSRLMRQKARATSELNQHGARERAFAGAGTGARASRYGRLARDAGGRVDQLDRAISEVRGRITDLSNQRSRVPTDHPRVQRLHDRLSSAVKEQSRRQAAFERTFARVAPARYHPALERALLARAQTTLEGRGLAGPELDMALSDLQRHDVGQWFTPKEWTDLKREVQSTWQELANSGFHPVWMQNVEDRGLYRAFSSKPLGERVPSVAAVRNRVFDLKPRIDNLAVGLTKPAVELLNREASRAFIMEQVAPKSMSVPEMLSQVRQLARESGWDAAQTRAYIEDNFRMFDAASLSSGAEVPRAAGALLQASENEAARVVPTQVYESVHALIRPPTITGKVGRLMTRTTMLNKYAVMSLSIKHMVHVQLGGLVQLMMRGGKEEFSVPRWLDAFRQVKSGEQEIGLANAEDRWTPDQQLGLVHGNFLAKLWNSTGGALANRIRTFDEFVANVQRTVGYTAEYDRQLARGVDDIAAKEAALRHAHKTLVSIDSLTPLEQTIVRQVFPFYAFTRHILRYVLTYPIDYPLRAAILARIVSIENTQNNSLLPEQFRMLFFFGHPDQNGNVQSLDIRGLNPFRDVANNMTLTGFIRGLNPVGRALFEAVGVNTMTGAPSPYQNLTYDPVSGKLVASRPPHGLLNIAAQEIPQFNLIDHYFQLTSSMRHLKATNPEAYKAQVYNYFFVPTFQPKNIPQTEAQSILDQLRVAQNAESLAMTGDTSQLSRFNAVPFQGQFVSTEWLRHLVAALQAQNPAVAPKAQLQRPKRKRNRTGF